MARLKEQIGLDVATGYRRAYHPGIIIRKRLMKDTHLSQKELCAKFDINESTFSRILNGSQPITANTAIKLARAFGMSEMFFMNLQQRHDIEKARGRQGGVE